MSEEITGRELLVMLLVSLVFSLFVIFGPRLLTSPVPVAINDVPQWVNLNNSDNLNPPVFNQPYDLDIQLYNRRDPAMKFSGDWTQTVCRISFESGEFRACLNPVEALSANKGRVHLEPLETSHAFIGVKFENQDWHNDMILFTVRQ